MSVLNIYPPPEKTTKFLVVGLIASPNFQKCRYLVQKLYNSYPKKYENPEIRPMLNVDWQEYIIKMRRRFGKVFYLLKEPVAVFIDGEFIGDDKALTKHIMKNYIFELSLDFISIANKELIDYFQDITENKKRSFVYFTIAIDEHVAGSLLFVLYNDLVPVTCKNFIACCNQSYKWKPIHRIVKKSWIQCGGWNLRHKNQPCENYIVPHNRRGVLSMCNAYKHTDNSTQFFITLDSTPWMDYKYVAFGQCVQGAEILSLIENIPTYYQNPLHKITIVDCGLFSLCPDADQPEKSPSQICNLDRFYSTFSEIKDDYDSLINLSDFKKGKYFLRSDLRPYFPFMRYSRMFDSYSQIQILSGIVGGEEQEDYDSVPESPVKPVIKSTEEMEIERLKQLSEQFGLKSIGTHIII